VPRTVIIDPQHSMPRIVFKKPQVFTDLGEFTRFVGWYIRTRGYKWFSKFEILKDILVDLLYQKRGKYTRPFMHFGTIGLVFLVITVGPVLLTNKDSEFEGQGSQTVISAAVFGDSFSTSQAEEVSRFRGGEIIRHVVADGETISSIATRYNLDSTTVMWENDLTDNSVLKPGQELRILPVDGLRHKVARGETIYSIAKKYGLDSAQAQVIVDYPFNEFINDETFELATGQQIMIPGGVPPQTAAPVRKIAQPTPVDVVQGAGSGQFLWPAAGTITQGYSFYHKAIDIANRSAGPILAADSGTVIGAGWLDNSGYGNRVMIDHGNGFVSLYAHMSVVQVSAGQQVSRGSVLGQMGSTGRSTGTHLHFEIRKGGLLNPLSFLN